MTKIKEQIREEDFTSEGKELKGKVQREKERIQDIRSWIMVLYPVIGFCE